MRRIRAEPRGFFYFIQNCAGAIARKEKRNGNNHFILHQGGFDALKKVLVKL